MDVAAAEVAFKQAWDAWVRANTYGVGDLDMLADDLESCRRELDICRLDAQFDEPLLWEGSD